MIIRTFVIILAFGAMLMQLTQGAWIEAAGLAGLGTGLLILRMWPSQRWLSWLAFSVTAVAMIVRIVRLQAGA